VTFFCCRFCRIWQTRLLLPCWTRPRCSEKVQHLVDRINNRGSLFPIACTTTTTMTWTTPVFFVDNGLSPASTTINSKLKSYLTIHCSFLGQHCFSPLDFVLMLECSLIHLLHVFNDVKVVLDSPLFIWCWVTSHQFVANPIGEGLDPKLRWADFFTRYGNKETVAAAISEPTAFSWQVAYATI
jgi:hypothetical protein